MEDFFILIVLILYLIPSLFLMWLVYEENYRIKKFEIKRNKKNTVDLYPNYDNSLIYYNCIEKIFLYIIIPLLIAYFIYPLFNLIVLKIRCVTILTTSIAWLTLVLTYASVSISLGNNKLDFLFSKKDTSEYNNIFILLKLLIIFFAVLIGCDIIILCFSINFQEIKLLFTIILSERIISFARSFILIIKKIKNIANFFNLNLIFFKTISLMSLGIEFIIGINIIKKLTNLYFANPEIVLSEKLYQKRSAIINIRKLDDDIKVEKFKKGLKHLFDNLMNKISKFNKGKFCVINLNTRIKDKLFKTDNNKDEIYFLAIEIMRKRNVAIIFIYIFYSLFYILYINLLPTRRINDIILVCIIVMILFIVLFLKEISIYKNSFYNEDFAEKYILYCFRNEAVILIKNKKNLLYSFKLFLSKQDCLESLASFLIYMRLLVEYKFERELLDFVDKKIKINDYRLNNYDQSRQLLKGLLLYILYFALKKEKMLNDEILYYIIKIESFPIMLNLLKLNYFNEDDNEYVNLIKRVNKLKINKKSTNKIKIRNKLLNELTNNIVLKLKTD